MLEQHDYLVPDYYPEFRCKISACRHTCCENWPITITMTDYFRLLSVPCSEELRRCLDTYLHLCDHPSPERYAQICPKYDGDCSLRLGDGRCGLQAELGETALSTVCRLYPRGVRYDGDYECSCANSCEAVLEQFIHREAPLAFVRRNYSYQMPDAGERINAFEPLGRGQAIRLYLIRVMQDRRQPVFARLMTLGRVLQDVAEAIARRDGTMLDELLAHLPPLEASSEYEVTPRHIVRGLEIAEAMMARVDERCQRLHDFGEAALECFRQTENPLELYQCSCDKMTALLPNWPAFFEHILVNHMFFQQFPFQDRPMDLNDEFIGLCGIYSMLRFMGIGWLAAGHTAESELIDVWTAAFRLIEHTSFDLYATVLLKELGCEERKALLELVNL